MMRSTGSEISKGRRSSGGGQSKKLRKVMYETRQSEDFEVDDVKTYEEVSLLYPRPGLCRPLILIGPPGVGRNELKRRLLMLNPDRFGTTVPHTSRPPRPGNAPPIPLLAKLRVAERSPNQTNCRGNGRRRLSLCPPDGHGALGERGPVYRVRRVQRQSVRDSGRVGEMCPRAGPNAGAQSPSAGASTPTDARSEAVHPLRQAATVSRPEGESVDGEGSFHFRVGQSDLQKWFCVSHRLFSPCFSSSTSAYSRGFTDDELQQMIQSAQHLEQIYGHWFDYSLVNGNLEFAFRELCDLLQRIDKDAEWVPSTWVR